MFIPVFLSIIIIIIIILATGWTVRGSNPGGGEIFRTRPDRPWDPPSLQHNGYWVFTGGKAAVVLTPTPTNAEVKERV
jgi:hypothetical protein